MRSYRKAIVRLRGLANKCGGPSCGATHPAIFAPTHLPLMLNPFIHGTPSSDFHSLGAFNASQTSEEFFSMAPSFWPIRHYTPLQQVLENDGNELDVTDPVTEAKPRGVRMYFDFRVLVSPDDVERVINRMGENVTASQLCAALNRLKYLKEPPSEEFMDKLAKKLVSRLDRILPRHIAGIWHGCARLRYINSELITGLREITWRTENLERYSAFELSHIVYGMGVLQKTKEMLAGVRVGNGPVPEWGGRNLYLLPDQESLAKELAEKTLISQHPIRFGEMEIPTIIYGYGLLRFTQTEWLDPLFQEAMREERLKCYTCPDLANMLYGLAMMGVQDELVLNPLLEEICSKNRLARFREAEWTSIVQSLRLLDVQNDDVLHAVRNELLKTDRIVQFSEHAISMIASNLRALGVTQIEPLIKELTRPDLAGSIAPQGVVMALYNLCSCEDRDKGLVEEMVEKALNADNLRKYREWDLASLMFSLSALRHDYHREGMYDGILEELQEPERIHRYDSGNFSNIFYGGGKLMFRDLLEGLLVEIVKPEKLSDFKTSHLYSIVYGLGQIETEDHENVTMLMEEVLKRLDKFNSTQLSIMIYSLGKMEYKKHDVLKALLTEGTKEERLKEFSCQGLSSIVYGLSFTEFRDGKLLGSLLKEVILPKRIAAFSDSELGIILYGLGKTGVEDSRVITPLLDEVLKPARLHNFRNSSMVSILHGLSQLERYDEHAWEMMLKECNSSERLGQFRPSELSLIFYACGMKRHKSRSHLKGILGEMIKQKKLERVSANGLSSTLFSFTLLDVVHEGVIDRVAREFIQPVKLEAATPNQIATVFYSLGVLRFRDKDMARTLKEEIMKPDRMCGLSRQGLYNVMFGLAELRYRSPKLLNELWKEMIKIERLSEFTDREWGTIAHCYGQLRYKEEEVVLALRDKILTSRGLPVDAWKKARVGVSLREIRADQQKLMQMEERRDRRAGPEHVKERIDPDEGMRQRLYGERRLDERWLDADNTARDRGTGRGQGFGRAPDDMRHALLRRRPEESGRDSAATPWGESPDTRHTSAREDRYGEHPLRGSTMDISLDEKYSLGHGTMNEWHRLARRSSLARAGDSFNDYRQTGRGQSRRNNGDWGPGSRREDMREFTARHPGRFYKAEEVHGRRLGKEGRERPEPEQIERAVRKYLPPRKAHRTGPLKRDPFMEQMWRVPKMEGDSNEKHMPRLSREGGEGWGQEVERKDVAYEASSRIPTSYKSVVEDQKKAAQKKDKAVLKDMAQCLDGFAKSLKF